MTELSPELADFQARVGCDERALAGLQQLPPGDQLVAMDIVEKQQCKNPSAVTWSAVKTCQKAPARARMDYLLRHLDERAAEALNQLAPSTQEGICQKLDLSNVRNLSAFVFSQIRSAAKQPQFTHAPAMQATRVPAYGPATYGMMPTYGRDRSRSPMGVEYGYGRPQQMSTGKGKGVAPPHMVSGYGTGPGQGSSQMVDAFRMHYPIDDGAARALESLNPEDQFIVCGLVEKQQARNPSAVTWSMCKLVRDKPTQAKLEYLRHVIDDKCAAALERLGPEELEQLLSEVELSRIRNVSAFLWSRVKATAGFTADGGEMHQERPQQSQAPSRPRHHAPIQTMQIPETDNDVLESVASMGLMLDKRCQAKLGELSHEDQMQILSSVDDTVRNPSAYVWSKIKAR